MDHVECTGKERSLTTECRHNVSRKPNCDDHSKNVGVVCTSDVRLQDGGGVTHHQGRVEVYYNGAWGTVCDNGWDLADASVVCRQLGFEGALEASKLAAFGEGAGKIWMSNVRCTGMESSLKECSHNGWGRHFHCGHGKDAGVMCSYAGGTKAQTHILRKAILIGLSILLFVCFVGTGFVTWRLWYHLYAKKQNTSEDTEEDIEIFEENNAAKTMLLTFQERTRHLCTLGSVL
ncbi:CD5 molecule-like [Porites harrisoni]